MNLATDTSESHVTQLARKAKKALRKKNIGVLTTSVHSGTNRPIADGLTVLGPYRNRDKWRLVLVEGTERKSLCVASHAEALALKDKLERDDKRSKTQTIGALLQTYREYLCNVRCVLPSTAEHVHERLAFWLPVSMLATSLTPEKANRLYVELTQNVSEKTGKLLSVATQQFSLTLAKGWGKWAVKERFLSFNPFADIAAVGRSSSGKTQLRIDEARQLSQLAETLANAGDSGALGVLLMLHLGLRQGEVRSRVARDVDAGGAILWIPSGKTKNAARRLKVPECLRAPLVALARKKEPNQLLFTDRDTAPSRSYFQDKVRQLCTQANVPRVCPHSLRGLHATLALEAGATSSMVAQALGHGSFKITARHYASEDSVQGARMACVAEALAGGAEDPVSRVLSSLTPAQLDELKGRLK